MMSFQKILVAIDEDPVAAHAAEVGMDLARHLNAQVALIYVIDPTLILDPEAGIGADDLVLKARQDAARIVADFRARLQADARSLGFTPLGSPGSEIVKAAQEWHADVIVIGSHGRRGVTRALVGSVAEGVMRHAPCPVMVVRAAA
jgi:nucleotide-binding universal stress UspA family protein